MFKLQTVVPQMYYEINSSTETMSKSLLGQPARAAKQRTRNGLLKEEISSYFH